MLNSNCNCSYSDYPRISRPTGCNCNVSDQDSSSTHTDKNLSEDGTNEYEAEDENLHNSFELKLKAAFCDRDRFFKIEMKGE